MGKRRVTPPARPLRAGSAPISIFRQRRHSHELYQTHRHRRLYDLAAGHRDRGHCAACHRCRRRRPARGDLLGRLVAVLSLWGQAGPERGQGWHHKLAPARDDLWRDICAVSADWPAAGDAVQPDPRGDGDHGAAVFVGAALDRAILYRLHLDCGRQCARSDLRGLRL